MFFQFFLVYVMFVYLIRARETKIRFSDTFWRLLRDFSKKSGPVAANLKLIRPLCFFVSTRPFEPFSGPHLSIQFSELWAIESVLK